MPLLTLFMAGYQVTFTFTVLQLATKFALQVNIQGYCTDGSVCEITFLTMCYYNITYNDKRHYILPNVVNTKHISAKGPDLM